jgi:hypothetical protein
LKESWKRALQPSRAPTTKYIGSFSESGGSTPGSPYAPVNARKASESGVAATIIESTLEERPAISMLIGPTTFDGMSAA